MLLHFCVFPIRLTHAECISFLGLIANARQSHAVLIVALCQAQRFALANCLIDSCQTGSSAPLSCLHIRLAFRTDSGAKSDETHPSMRAHMAHT